MREVSQVKNQSLPELFIGGETKTNFILGSPYLGTQWILEYLNVTYQGELGGAIVGNSTFRVIARLKENEAILSEIQGPVLTIKEKTSELAPFSAIFQFPQPPVIAQRQQLEVEVELIRITGTGNYPLRQGRVTMGYTIQEI